MAVLQVHRMMHQSLSESSPEKRNRKPSAKVVAATSESSSDVVKVNGSVVNTEPKKRGRPKGTTTSNNTQNSNSSTSYVSSPVRVPSSQFIKGFFPTALDSAEKEREHSSAASLIAPSVASAEIELMVEEDEADGNGAWPTSSSQSITSPTLTSKSAAAPPSLWNKEVPVYAADTFKLKTGAVSKAYRLTALPSSPNGNSHNGSSSSSSNKASAKPTITTQAMSGEKKKRGRPPANATAAASKLNLKTSITTSFPSTT
eukprot:gene22510-28639_t